MNSPTISLDIGPALRMVRQAAGLTQKQVAEEIGVCAKTVRNWEHQRIERIPPLYSRHAERWIQEKLESLVLS